MQSGTFFVFLTDYWQTKSCVKTDLSYILCHGSGNRFVMFDATEHPALWAEMELDALSREASSALQTDGILLLCRHEEEYAMRMFNTDGSEAEMCGNGIRCVARLARERYLREEHFTLWSGGRPYPASHERPLFEGLPTYGVDIAVRLQGGDFPRGGERFLDREIPELDPALRFSYLNLGNPHIVAAVEEIDEELLIRLGERVKQLPEWFPRGVNVSLIRPEGPQQIFVATCERGVGITHSCGTAMTASTTAATLLGLCRADEEVEVRNRGGQVRCRCHLGSNGITTRLVGNASFIEEGRALWQEGKFLLTERYPRSEEVACFAHFIEHLTQD